MYFFEVPITVVGEFPGVVDAGLFGVAGMGELVLLRRSYSTGVQVQIVSSRICDVGKVNPRIHYLMFQVHSRSILNKRLSYG